MATRNENIQVAYKSTHPGEVLAEWIEDIGVKQKDFASSIDLPASRLNELLKGKRPMTMEIAQRLEARLGMRASYWMELQANYEYNERMLALRNTDLTFFTKSAI